MSQINQITKIERMLEAMLMASNKLHWIGGYIYGRTSNDDPFITLYPAADYLSNKICKVYPQDFRKLPPFIDPENFPKKDFFQSDSKTAVPDKETAIKRRLYHYCPLFQVVLYDGKETSMGPEQRFGNVLVITDNTNHVPVSVTATQPNQRKQINGVNHGSVGFYEAAYDSNSAIYPDVAAVQLTAALICSEWKPDNGLKEIAMGNALAEYAQSRADSSSEGKEKGAAHKDALQKAKKKYITLAEAA